MKLPKDKRDHLILGIPLAALLWLLLYVVSPKLGAPAAIAFGSVALGVGVELYQMIRHEGQPEVLDAICSAAAGILLSFMMLLL